MFAVARTWDAMTCRRWAGVLRGSKGAAAGRRRVRFCGCKAVFRQYTGGAPWQTQTRGKFLDVIARSEATWQSASLRQHEMKSNTLGESEKHYEFALRIANLQSFSAETRIAAPVCALVRNDMLKTGRCQRLQERGTQ